MIMTFAFSMNVFAANSVTNTADISKITDADGKAIENSAGAPAETLTPQQAANIIGEGNVGNISILYQKSIMMPDGTRFPVQVTFNINGLTANSNVKALLYNGSTWEIISSTAGTNSLTVSLNANSTIAIVLDTVAGAAVSPKTGEDNTVPTAVAIAVIACAAALAVTRVKPRLR